MGNSSSIKGKKETKLTIQKPSPAVGTVIALPPFETLSSFEFKDLHNGILFEDHNAH